MLIRMLAHEWEIPALLGGNDAVDGILKVERWRRSRHLSSLSRLNESSFSIAGRESICIKFT